MDNMNTGDFTLAIEHLRQDIRERDERQTVKIDALAEKTDNWQNEVRAEFGAVKSRLDIIETKITTKEQDMKRAEDEKEKSFSHLSGIAALIVAIATAIVMWVKGG